MTEPGAGSDLQGIRTTAKRDGDHYIINGSKTFITNGQHCDMVIVVARTNPDVAGSKGTTLFLVDTNLPGFQRGRNLEKIGLHAAGTSELFFEDVRGVLFCPEVCVELVSECQPCFVLWCQSDFDAEFF